MSPVTGEHLRAIADVLGRVSNEVNQSGGVIVMRFFAIVETMDADGGIGLEAFYTEGMAPWDQLGLLDFQRQATLDKIQFPD
jgi:hypothetical protein